MPFYIFTARQAAHFIYDLCCKKNAILREIRFSQAKIQGGSIAVR